MSTPHEPDPRVGIPPTNVLDALHSDHDLRQLVGCFVDANDQPEWARKIARWATDRLKANCRCQWRGEDAIAARLRGLGRRKRSCHFQLAMQLDANILADYQRYNNCTAWSTRGAVGCCLAYDMIAKGELHKYQARPGTAGIYANRGTRADGGEAISDGVAAVHLNGITLEIDYPGVADLSTRAKDEEAGVRWGRSGVPRELAQIVAGDTINQVSSVEDEQAVLDIMAAGAAIVTGSTLTAGNYGDPVCELAPVGGHAQALIGVDDTDEFREWYRQTTGRELDDWVGIFDQTWPESACAKISNWPEHLWGPRPPGAFVLRGHDAMRLIDNSGFGQGIAISAVEGFDLGELPDWGASTVLGP